MRGAVDSPSSGSSGTSTPWAAVLAVWLLGAALMLFAGWGAFSPTHFLDGDDALRLQQVRDLLAGQGWFDLTQNRIAPPDGVPMHWTRIVDLPIATVIVLLRPLLGMAQAEVVAIVLVPLLTLLAAMALTARLAARQFGAKAGAIAALLVLTAVPASFRMMPLRIDHHGWQYVLALVALNGMASRSVRGGGAVAGLALALSLAISLESLPLAVIFAGVCALRLLRGDDRWLVSYMASLALGGAGLFLLTRGLGDLADYCDALSPVHVAVLLWVAGVCALALPRLRTRPPALGMAVLGIAGLGAVAIMGLRAPQCLSADAFGALDPLVKTVWLQSVVEGLPFWRQGLVLGATMVLLPALGLLACWRLWCMAQNRQARDFWVDTALLLAGATLVGLLVARASAVACLFAAVPAAWQIEEQIARWSADRLLLRRLARVLLIVALFVPGALVGMAASAINPPKPPSGKLIQTCDFAALAPQIAAMPRATILSGLDIGPTLLVTSNHTVIATAHHRASAAMRDLIVAFLGPDHGARKIMAQRGATLVVVCPSGGESRVYRKLAPNGFMAHLVKGRAPDWLEPVPVDPQSGVKVWRVR
ncbi:MAG: hypothetical protein Q8R81_07375 [Novosphingobium sp.]|uniref:hypothetical protein n=1 Tax=Novosphingobium sp. TaxID=1874826 RepID=UPI002736558F|nr:hypothetical protein [Novosphingobium sp.]MDP3550200.1 hypothetical protein [Novosphingobium sp.]